MSYQESAISGSSNNLWFKVEWNESQTNSTFTIAPLLSRWDRYQTVNNAGYDEWLVLPDWSWGSWSITRSTTSAGYYVDVDSFSPRTYAKGHTANTIHLDVYFSNIGTAYDGYFHSIGSSYLRFSITVPALNSYVVSYDANGGTGAPQSQTKWYGETLVLSSVVPTRENYIFKGWSTSQDGTVLYSAGGNYTPNTGVTLYAVWELALIPPIATLTAYRVGSPSSTTETTDGSYAYATVVWSVDRTKSASNTLASFSATVIDEDGRSIQKTISGTTSGASGVGTIRFSASSGLLYNLTVVLVDSDGASTTKTAIVPSVTYPIMVQRVDGQDVVTIPNLKTDNQSVTLYDDPSGNNGNVTLSESVDGFDYMRVYFFVKRENDTDYASTDVCAPDGKTVSLFAVRHATRGSRFNYSGATYLVSGSSMTRVSTGSADSGGGLAGDADTYIYRVEAWTGYANIGYISGSGGGSGGGTPVDVLYFSESGTTGSVSLSKSLASYDHMRVFFRKTNDVNQCGSVDVFSPNGKYVSMTISEPYNDTGITWFSSKVVYANGTNITNRDYAVSETGNQTYGSGSNEVAIYRVEAWNETSGSNPDIDWTQSSYANGYYMRRGKMVSVLCESYGNITAPNNDYATAFTLPEGFRPILPTGKSLWGSSSTLGGSYPVTWRIDQDGKVYVGGNGTSTGYWAFNATFPCE